MCRSNISSIILKAVQDPPVFLPTRSRSFASLRMTAYVALALNSAHISLKMSDILLKSFVLLVSQQLPELAALL